MKELVLTGFADFWPADGTARREALYLGPWCFVRNPHCDLREQRKHTLVPVPWNLWEASVSENEAGTGADGEQDVPAAAACIDELFDRVMAAIAGEMNAIYGVNKSQDFWSHMMSTWLLHWLGVYYDRYQRIQSALSATDHRFIVKVARNYRQLVRVADPGDHFAVFNLHDYNLGLYSELLALLKLKGVTRKSAKLPLRQPSLSLRSLVIAAKKELRWFLYRWRTIDLQVPAKAVHLDTADLTESERNHLEAGFPKKTESWRDLRRAVPAYVRRFRRRALRGFEPRNEFEDLVQRAIAGHVPDSFFELTLPRESDCRRLSIGYPSGSVGEAESLENGGRTICAQHGSGYGWWRSFPFGKIEFELAGSFITWGWDHKHCYDAEYIPLPAPKLSRLERAKEISDRILVIYQGFPEYVYRLHTIMFPEQMLPYLEDRMEFLRELNGAVRKRLDLKAPPEDYGGNDIQLIESTLGEDCRWKTGPASAAIVSSALSVHDYPGTAFLESIAVDCPTIGFWRPDFFKLCPEAHAAFQRLAEVEVIFADPRAAAATINSIENGSRGGSEGGIKAWWNAPERRAVVAEFRETYARVDPEWRSIWSDWIAEALAEFEAGTRRKPTGAVPA